MVSNREQLLKKIVEVTDDSFFEVAKAVYDYQMAYNSVMSNFAKNLNRKTLDQFIYLPISAFKNHKIQSGDWKETIWFESSGTTGNINSKHYCRQLDWYHQNCVRNFEQSYGPCASFCFLGLLPHYLERQHSSLVSMVQHFIHLSPYKQSGFFLNDVQGLIEVLDENKRNHIPTVLFGVSFALKEVAMKFSLDFPSLIVIETGGMKGRGEELTRTELHQIIADGFGVEKVHSEYGMTELFSQAYSKHSGIFYPSPTLKISIREITDPLTHEQFGKTGVIHVIDLANIDTCSFIATEDLGRLYPDGSFEVLGRLDNSDMRGCNLMIDQ